MTNTRPPSRGTPPIPRRVATCPGQYDPGARLGVGADRRQVPQPRSSALSGVLLYGGVALLALGVGAATFFIMSPPSDYIRREIIARVKAETGRDLTIAGGTSFTVFPSLGLRLSDVSLSAPPSMGGDPFVKAANFDVGVRLLPLLRQEIVVDRLELNEPVFSLRVDAEGRKAGTWPASICRCASRTDRPVSVLGISLSVPLRQPSRARSPRCRSTTSASPTAPCATATSAMAPGAASRASTRASPSPPCTSRSPAAALSWPRANLSTSRAR